MPQFSTSRRDFLRNTAALGGLAATHSLIGVTRAGAQSPAKVRMQLGWLASNGIMGEVVAQKKGFYAEEGVELEITPGGPNVDGVGGVAAGRSTLGTVSSSPSVMLARSEGIPVKAIAGGYQKHPFTYFSLADNPIHEPKDMVGKTIATQPTAFILARALLAKNGLSEDEVSLVNMGSDMNQLMTGQADAVTGWLTNTEALKILGDDRVDLMLWDTGIQLYANVYYTTDQVLNESHDVLESYLRGSARGWGYARENPEEAVDYAAGMHLVQGILLALMQREKTGEGQHVAVSLYNSMLAMQMQEAAAHMMRGRDLNWAAFPLTGVYETTDKPVVMVGAFKENPLRDICAALEIEDLSLDPRYADFDSQAENRAELQAIFRDCFARKDCAHWLRRLEEVDILCAPVRTLAEALEDEQTLVNRMIVEAGRTEAGPLRLVGSPIDMSAAPLSIRQAPPRLGEHNSLVLGTAAAPRKVGAA